MDHPVFSKNVNKYNFDMITHRRVNNDICTENNNVRYINYDTFEYKNKINTAMENERVS